MCQPVDLLTLLLVLLKSQTYRFYYYIKQGKAADHHIKHYFISLILHEFSNFLRAAHKLCECFRRTKNPPIYFKWCVNSQWTSIYFSHFISSKHCYIFNALLCSDQGIFSPAFVVFVLFLCVVQCVAHSSDAMTGRGEWRRLQKAACLRESGLNSSSS